MVGELVTVMHDEHGGSLLCYGQLQCQYYLNLICQFNWTCVGSIWSVFIICGVKSSRLLDRYP